MKADYCLKSSAVFTGIEEKTKEACILIKKNRIIDVVPFEMKDKFIDENKAVFNVDVNVITLNKYLGIFEDMNYVENSNIILAENK